MVSNQQDQQGELEYMGNAEMLVEQSDDIIGELEYTKDNVEKILDELRPYLINDGGNVSLKALDGPIVKVQLEGACGSCPSATMTMSMGIERRLKQAFPEVEQVV